MFLFYIDFAMYKTWNLGAYIAHFRHELSLCKPGISVGCMFFPIDFAMYRRKTKIPECLNRMYVFIL